MKFFTFQNIQTCRHRVIVCRQYKLKSKTFIIYVLAKMPNFANTLKPKFITMKIISSSALTILMCLFGLSSLYAQGWPEKYNGVMIQGFYWDSYQDTQWNNLESQADELAEYFNLIWIPQSGYCNTLTSNMGYCDIWWLDHKSAFGTEAQLRSMIKTFKAKGLGTIADVVINHKSGNKSWTDFPDEKVVGQNTGKTYTITWGGNCAPYICKTDECVKSGYKATGVADSGDDFDGSRDLDHSNLTVQNNIKVYLDFLLNELGYTGFRYDMVKGYAPKYTSIYNTSAKPQFSVGECWDGYARVTSWINGTKDASGKIQSAAFDFPFRDILKTAIESSNWAKLNESMLATSTQYQRYAVTFVDNHDTGSSGKDGANPLYKDVEAANAYMLAMPGTPCVFLAHWKSYKTTIKKLILLRRLLGIHNQSTIVSKCVSGDGYVVKVRGDKGDALVAIGPNPTIRSNGMKLALEGTDFKYYVSSSIDISSLDDVKEEIQNVTFPSFCKVEPGEKCAFFEAPASWTKNPKCWCWNSSANFTGGKWPGQTCTYIGQADNGNKVYKWTYTGSETSTPTFIIFNNNEKPQTADFKFVNGGYYTSTSNVGIVTGINDVKADDHSRANATYNLHGMRVGNGYKGIVIRNGKKYVNK